MTIDVAPTGNEHRKYHIAHLRTKSYIWKDKDGNKLEKPVDAINPRGGMTLAFRVTETTNKNDYPSIKISYGMAICHDVDRYNKEDGRNEAMKRANIALDTNIRPFDKFGTFSGSGTFVIDLPPSLILPNQELCSSKFLHTCILRAIFRDVQKCMKRKEIPHHYKELFYQHYETLDFKQDPEPSE